LYAEEQDEHLTDRALVSAYDGVVEADPNEDAGDNLVGYLDDDVGDEEGFPGVGFARTFADLV
jgi:hypothetical protein